MAASKHKTKKLGEKRVPKRDVYGELEAAMEDPKFRKAVREFIEITTS